MTVHDSSPSAERGHRDWLAALLLRQPNGFMARLATGAARWRALSRNSRRRWQRKVATTAAGAALILAMAGSSLLVPTVHAATITVDGTCTLVDAIRAANTNAVVGSCAAGAVGADTIDLQVDTTLTAYAGNYSGYTGLPAVTSEVTIEGNGHTIERDGAAPAFRILYIASNGDLTLNDVTISGGYDFTNAGGGFFVSGGMLTLNNSTVSNNEANFVGGGGFNGSGTLIITDSVFSYNKSYRGGGIYIDYSGAGTVTTLTTITGSLFEKNTATGHGGAIYMDKGELNIIDTAVIDNEAAYDGGGLKTYYPEALVTITGSTFANNSARQGGGMLIREGDVTLINSTLSGNRANSTGEGGGGVYNQNGSLELVNSTVTDNYAFYYGGGIVQMNPIASTTISRSIISGNIAVFGDANEIRFLGGALITGDHNVFGRGEQTNAAAFTGFTPGVTDVNANSDAGNIPLADILDPTLAANGGPTMTHNLVAGSPALDMAPDADCVAPSPTDGLDQRGFVRPFDVAGQGNEVTDTCDAGAVEYLSGPPAAAVFMSTRKPGITSDSLPFGSQDILKWDGSSWSKWFDGSAAGLTPSGKWKHDVNAFWIPDPAGDDVVISFTQNARIVPGIGPAKVDGMDLVWWDGSAFSLWFDGQDVGLTNKTQEKIDSLHVLPGSASPIGGGCLNYLLISTQGGGRVMNFDGSSLPFRGEDVLGFCMTNAGDNTTGLWHMVLDGSAVGMPPFSTDSISVSADGQTMYLTTRGAFNVPPAAGGPSMVYAYDFGTQTFSGPLFDAAANGLPEFVDGLQVEGDLN